MPLAIIIGMTSIALIYVAVNLSYFVVLTTTQMLESTNAVAMVFVFNYLMISFISLDIRLRSHSHLGLRHGHFRRDSAHRISQFHHVLCQQVSLFGCFQNHNYFRYLQAVSKQGQLPSAISGINPLSDSPRVALFVHILIAMGISFTGDLDNLINVARVERQKRSDSSTSPSLNGHNVQLQWEL